MCRGGQLIEIDAKACAEISLLIEIDDKGAIPGLGEAYGEIQGDCGFAAAALGVGEGKNVCIVPLSWKSPDKQLPIECASAVSVLKRMPSKPEPPGLDGNPNIYGKSVK
jgi:hypothetical protein